MIATTVSYESAISKGLVIKLLTRTPDAQKLAASNGDDLRDLDEMMASIPAVELKSSTKGVYVSALLTCLRSGLRLPALPDAIVQYLQSKSGALSRSTLRVHLAALRWYHVKAGLPDPTAWPKIKEALNSVPLNAKPGVGYCGKATGARGKAKPLMMADLRAINALLSPRVAKSPIILRDLTLLNLGFFYGLSRRDISAIRYADIIGQGDRMMIRWRGVKDDHSHGEQTIVVQKLPNNLLNEEIGSLCVFGLLSKWVQYVKTMDQAVSDSDAWKSNPVFRSMSAAHRARGQAMPLTGTSIQRIIIRRAKEASIEGADEFRGHSLRRGFLLSCISAGVPMNTAALTTRHLKPDTLQLYLRDYLKKYGNTVSLLLNPLPDALCVNLIPDSYSMG